MSARAREQPRTSARWPTLVELDEARGVGRVRGAGPRWTTRASPPRRAPAEARVVVLRQVERGASGVRDRAFEVAAHQRRARPVDACRRAGAGRTPRSTTTDVGLGRCSAGQRRPSTRSSVASSSSSTPSNSPCGHPGPARPMPRTGRSRSTSSGRASTQPPQRRLRRSRRAPAWRVSMSRRLARSRRRPARAGSPPRRRPAASYQALARAVQLGDALGLLVEQVRAQDVGEQVVVAVPAAAGRPAGRGTGWRGRAPRASPCRRWPPVTASHSGPVSRSRTEVSQQEVADVGGLAAAAPPRRGSRRRSGRRRRSRR